MTPAAPAVLKDVCEWNSQSKKLTERAQQLSWRLHSLKARTFGCISNTAVFTSINILRNVMQNVEVCAF